MAVTVISRPAIGENHIAVGMMRGNGKCDLPETGAAVISQGDILPIGEGAGDVNGRQLAGISVGWLPVENLGKDCFAPGGIDR